MEFSSQFITNFIDNLSFEANREHWMPVWQYDIIELQDQYFLESDKEIFVMEKLRTFYILLELINLQTLSNDNLKISYEKPNSHINWKVVEEEHLIKPIVDSNNNIKQFFCRIDSLTLQDSLHQTVKLFNRFISLLSLTYGSTFQIDTITIHDEENKRKFVVTNKSLLKLLPTISLDLLQGNTYNLDSNILKMISLYREGHTSTSIYYRFLCCYKILESIHKKQFFRTTNLLLKEVNLNRTTIKINKDVLVLTKCQYQYPDLLNKKVASLLDYPVIKTYRNKIAHGLLNNGELIDYDSTDDLTSMACIASLLDYYARLEIATELDYRNQIHVIKSTSNNT